MSELRSSQIIEKIYEAAQGDSGDGIRVVYGQQEFPNSVNASIFLAGPTPRDETVPSWRPRAIEYLRSIGYVGGLSIILKFLRMLMREIITSRFSGNTMLWIGQM